MFSPVKADVSMKSIPNFVATDRPDYSTHLSRNHSLISQVGFIADQQYLDVFGSKVLDLVHPLVNRLEATLISHTVSHNDSVRR